MSSTSPSRKIVAGTTGPTLPPRPFRQCYGRAARARSSGQHTRKQTPVSGELDEPADRYPQRGGSCVDEEVHVDDTGASTLVTSRNPDDLPAFCATIVKTFA